MNKRGQLTIFIIVAILIIAIVAVYFIFLQKTPENNNNDNVARDYSSLNLYVQECLDQTLSQVIESNSIRGGYYTIKGDYIVYTDNDLYYDSQIPYYLIDNTLYLPSKADFESQISLGVKNEFKNCLDFSSFNYEIDYNYSSMQVSSYIEQNLVKTKVHLLISANDGKSSVEFDEFTSQKTSDYYSLYSFAQYLTGKQRTNGRNLCLSCLVEESEKSGYDIYPQSLISNESYVLINTISDKNGGLLFSFAYKFNN